MQKLKAVSPSGSMQVRMIDLREANRQVELWHRHLGPVQGHKFSLVCETLHNLGRFRWSRHEGVAIVGRPVARHQDDGNTLEIRRLALAGFTPNTCSLMLAKCCQVSETLGYGRVLTYTLDEEIGSSLKAAGFVLDGYTRGGRGWSSRPGRTVVNENPKKRWIRMTK